MVFFKQEKATRKKFWTKYSLIISRLSKCQLMNSIPVIVQQICSISKLKYKQNIRYRSYRLINERKEKVKHFLNFVQEVGLRLL